MGREPPFEEARVVFDGLESRQVVLGAPRVNRVEPIHPDDRWVGATEIRQDVPLSSAEAFEVQQKDLIFGEGIRSFGKAVRSVEIVEELDSWLANRIVYHVSNGRRIIMLVERGEPHALESLKVASATVGGMTMVELLVPSVPGKASL